MFRHLTTAEIMREMDKVRNVQTQAARIRHAELYAEICARSWAGK